MKTSFRTVPDTNVIIASHLQPLNGHYPFKVCKTLEFLFELRIELANL